MGNPSHPSVTPSRPRQNRVDPFGALIATPARGTLMGNRGCLHDDQGRIRRAYQGQRWIICLLSFKDRRRQVMKPGHYTELFFVDEATALAAGHRPCAECQRERYNLFRSLWAAANPELCEGAIPAASLLDSVLHRQRITPTGEKVVQPARLGDLPDGVMILLPGEPTPYLLWHDALQAWSPYGYHPERTIDPELQISVLTPQSIVRTLAHGYPVVVRGWQACVELRKTVRG